MKGCKGCARNGSTERASSSVEESAETEVSTAEARAIAKEAYGYANPMVDGYRIQYAYFVDRGNPEYRAPWKRQPQNARIRYNQGLLLWQLGRSDAARLALERGLALAEEDAELLYALAYLYGATGERQKAYVYLQRLERLQPADPRVRPLKQQLFSRP